MIYVVIILLLVGLFFFYASYSIQASIYLKALCRVQTEEKIVYLTFDDGPDAKVTPQILDLLQKYGAKACFFCIGSKMTENRSIVERIRKEGHLIGIHSYDHRNTFPLMSKKRMSDDLRQCQSIVREITGMETRLFRPPFGVTNPTISATVKRLDLQVVGWNIRSLDTRCAEPSTVLRRIRKRLRPGSIILLHDRLPDAPRLLQEILIFLTSNQYRFNRTLPVEC